MSDAKNFDRHATNRCEPHKPNAPPCEMLIPVIAARMKQWRHLARLLVDSGDIRALASVAPPARNAEIAHPCRATVLLGDHMINLETAGISGLWQPAVLANAVGPLANALGDFRRNRHCSIRHFAVLQGLTCPGLENRQ